MQILIRSFPFSIVGWSIARISKPLLCKSASTFFTVSFSGIKTAISLIVKNKKKIDEELKSNISASFQNIVTDILIKKFNMTLKYLKNQNVNIAQLSLVGGVAANKFIYNKLEKECLKNNIEIILPPKNMLSDNAAMIGWACIKKLYNNNNINDLYFKENPRLTLGR